MFQSAELLRLRLLHTLQKSCPILYAGTLPNAVLCCIPLKNLLQIVRKLCADDIFPMVNIISKIGIENMADCFDAKEMADIMNSVDSTLDEADGKEGSDNAMADVLTKQIGIKVIMKLVGLLLKNLGKIKRELYQFLAGLSGMTEKEIAALPRIQPSLLGRLRFIFCIQFKTRCTQGIIKNNNNWFF